MNDFNGSSLTPTDTKRLDSVRLLTRLLVLSGCCNFIALLVGLYGCFVGNFWLPPHHLHLLSSFEESVEAPSLSHTLHHFHLLSLPQLVECLAETGCVKEGYPIRDLAISYLVWHHHFDVERALQALPPVQPTMLSLAIEGKPSNVPLYLGLTSDYHEALLAFGRREQWPITAEAMFALLKDPKTADHPCLKDAFCLSLPFQVLHKSLLSSQQESQEGWSLNFCFERVLEGDWQQFMQSVRAVGQHATSLHLARQTFLACYPPEKNEVINGGASQVLILSAPSRSIEKPIVMSHKPKEVEKPVVMSHKPKEVVKDVVKSVAKVAKNELKSISLGATNRGTPTAAYSIPKLYIVRTGDSLWKIARAFQVDVDKIKSYNALQSDRLQPGLNLLIP